MKKNPGRKDRRRVHFGQKRELSDLKMAINEIEMKKAARVYRKRKGHTPVF